MIWLLAGALWGVLLWARMRRFKTLRRDAATSGELREMGGRGGF